MNARCVLSDHVYDWSDRSIRQAILRVAAAAPDAAAEAATVGRDPARLAYRALQALRQTGLQVRRRPGPWPEVLPIGELSRRAAAHGLRAAGRRCRDPRAGRQLPSGSDGPRGNLRDQPRAVTAPRG